jgi:hypothetical protein
VKKYLGVRILLEELRNLLLINLAQIRHRREGINDSYVGRMVNLTTLVPDIVAAILDERLPEEVTLFGLAAGTPLLRGGAAREA